MQKGKELTPKQKAFADEYLTDLNGTRAYKEVYRNVKNDATAAAAASRLLKNVKVKAYIAERMKEIQTEKTADLEEVIRFFSSVMRGEVKDQFGLDAALGDRLKAGDSLMKRYAVSEKNTISEQMAEDPLTKALKEEQLQWPNFLDTEGIADIYKVKFVPTMYLIDAQGVMVGENLRGEALANKLAELFGEIE